jgi:two-component system NtrC family sensor kinase
MQFRLVRYFTLASVGLFAAVAGTLAYLDREKSVFVETIQRKEIDFVKQVQAGFAKQQEQAALKDLVNIYETGNITLTRVFANTFWDKDFAPLLAKATQISIDHCHAIADVTNPEGKTVAPPEKKACFSEVGQKIRALPEFAPLDAKLFDAMKKTAIVKIKVFDLRGLTVYASEHAQVGEDKSGNGGYKGAAKGEVKSDLSFRDKFNAFEGVIEKRDLVSSYLPVFGPAGQVIGVFEVYTDTTPMMNQIKETSAKIAGTLKANETKMEQVSADNMAVVGDMSRQGLMVLGALLAILFISLFLIVRRAQKIIEQQARDRENDHQKMAQNEKMASLGQMVAGVAHQLNTPLAFSKSNINMVMDAMREFELPLKVGHSFARAANQADGDTVTLNIAPLRRQLEQMDDEADVSSLTQMLADTLQGIDQMADLVENLRDFTRLDRAKIAEIDINKGLKTVTYIARSAIPNRIEVVEDYGQVPRLECNPSQLNQVFLNLINNAAQAIPGEGKVTIRTRMEGGLVRIDVSDTGTGIPPEVQSKIFDTYFTTKPVGEGTGLGLPIVKSIVEEHGGEVKFTTRAGVGTTFSVFLPTQLPDEPMLKAA